MFGAGYFLFVRPMAREIQELERTSKAKSREVGLRSGMTQTEKDRAWDAHYAKKGLKLDGDRLVRVDA